jgi:hypothetical protein
VASLFFRGREGTFQQGEYHGDGAMRVKAKKWAKIGIFIFIAVAVLVSVSDVRKMIHLSAKLDPYFLGLSFCAAFVSYLLIAISLKKILELMDLRLPFLEILAISWVSTSINYVLSSGGVGGFTARVYLLKKKGGIEGAGPLHLPRLGRLPFYPLFLLSDYPLFHPPRGPRRGVCGGAIRLDSLVDSRRVWSHGGIHGGRLLQPHGSP